METYERFTSVRIFADKGRVVVQLRCVAEDGTLRGTQELQLAPDGARSFAAEVVKYAAKAEAEKAGE